MWLKFRFGDLFRACVIGALFICHLVLAADAMAGQYETSMKFTAVAGARKVFDACKKHKFITIQRDNLEGLKRKMNLLLGTMDTDLQNAEAWYQYDLYGDLLPDHKKPTLSRPGYGDAMASAWTENMVKETRVSIVSATKSLIFAQLEAARYELEKNIDWFITQKLVSEYYPEFFDPKKANVVALDMIAMNLDYTPESSIYAYLPGYHSEGLEAIQILYPRAVKYVNAKDYDKAAVAIEGILSVRPKEADAAKLKKQIEVPVKKYIINELHDRIKRLKKADSIEIIREKEHWLMVLQKLEPSSENIKNELKQVRSRIVLENARFIYQNKQYQKAMDKLSSLLEQNPDYKEAKRLLDDVKKAFKKSIAEEKVRVKEWLKTSKKQLKTYEKEKKWYQVIQLARKMLGADPDNKNAIEAANRVSKIIPDIKIKVPDNEINAYVETMTAHALAFKKDKDYERAFLAANEAYGSIWDTHDEYSLISKMVYYDRYRNVFKKGQVWKGQYSYETDTYRQLTWHFNLIITSVSEDYQNIESVLEIVSKNHNQNPVILGQHFTEGIFREKTMDYMFTPLELLDKGKSPGGAFPLQMFFKAHVQLNGIIKYRKTHKFFAKLQDEKRVVKVPRSVIKAAMKKKAIQKKNKATANPQSEPASKKMTNKMTAKKIDKKTQEKKDIPSLPINPISKEDQKKLKADVKKIKKLISGNKLQTASELLSNILLSTIGQGHYYKFSPGMTFKGEFNLINDYKYPAELMIDEGGSSNFKTRMRIGPIENHVLLSGHGQLIGNRITLKNMKRIKGDLVLPKSFAADIYGDNIIGNAQTKNSPNVLKFNYFFAFSGDPNQHPDYQNINPLIQQIRNNFDELMTTHPELWLHLASKHPVNVSEPKASSVFYALKAQAHNSVNQSDKAREMLQRAVKHAKNISDLPTYFVACLDLADLAFDLGFKELTPEILQPAQERYLQIKPEIRDKAYSDIKWAFLGKYLLAGYNDHFDTFFKNLGKSKCPTIGLSISLASAHSFNAAQYYMHQKKAPYNAYILELASLQKNPQRFQQTEKFTQVNHKSHLYTLLARSYARMGNIKQIVKMHKTKRKAIGRSDNNMLSALAYAYQINNKKDAAYNIFSQIDDNHASKISTLTDLVQLGSTKNQAPSFCLDPTILLENSLLKNTYLTAYAKQKKAKPTSLEYNPSFGTLGIFWVKYNEKQKWLQIESIIPKGPAATAGLKKGEKIIGFMGNPISSAHQIFTKPLFLKEGTPVSLTILKKGKKKRRIVLNVMNMNRVR